MSNLDEIVVHVATAPDAADDGARIARLAFALNSAVSWRYLARFSVPGHGGFENPTPGHRLSRTLVLEQPDWMSLGVVVVLLRGRMPLMFDEVSFEEIIGWATDGPRVVVFEDLQRPVALSRETAREQDRIRAFADRIAQQPHALVRQLRPEHDFDDVVRQALASIARTRWLSRYGIARLVCRECGHSVSVDRGVGYCPLDGHVMVQAAALESNLPDHFGPYPLNGVIGRGAFGRIFLSLVPGQPHGALKTLIDPSNAQAAARLRRELQLLGSIEHDHIVRLVEANEVDGSPVGLLEYLSGRPLKFVVGAISPRQMLRFGLQLLAAVDAIHRAGMIHRDLKPGNIMLVDDPNRPADAPRLVLLDFGLGKHREHNLHENLTGTMLLGTPNYMAPEQLQTRHAIDGRADLYSVGVILYQGIAFDQRYPIPPLENPGVPAEVLAFIQRVLQTEARPLERSDVPDGVKAVVLKALARRPEARFATASEMAEALRRELNAWDRATPDLSDRSWLDWSPPERYFKTHNWGPSSDPDALTITVSSELTSGSPDARRRTSRLDQGSLPIVAPRPLDGRPAAPRSTDDAPRPGRRWRLTAAVLSVLIGAGVGLGLLVDSMLRVVPDDARVVVRVSDQHQHPVRGARVLIAGAPLPGTTDDGGSVSGALPPPVDGRWTVRVDVPPGYRAPGEASEFGPDSVAGEHTHHVMVEVDNPYAVAVPGGGQIPVALGEGSIRLLRSLRSSRLAWPEKAGLVALKAGTEVYACDEEVLPLGATLPPPEDIEGFFERCFGSAEDKATLRVRSPDDLAPRDLTVVVLR